MYTLFIWCIYYTHTRERTLLENCEMYISCSCKHHQLIFQFFFFTFSRQLFYTPKREKKNFSSHFHISLRVRLSVCPRDCLLKIFPLRTNAKKKKKKYSDSFEIQSLVMFILTIHPDAAKKKKKRKFTTEYKSSFFPLFIRTRALFCPQPLTRFFFSFSLVCRSSAKIATIIDYISPNEILRKNNQDQKKKED